MATENIVIKFVTDRTELKAAQRGVKGLTDEEKKLQNELDDVNKSAKASNKTLQSESKKTAKETDKVTKSLDGVLDNIKNIRSTIAGGFIAGAIIGIGNEVIKLQKRIADARRETASFAKVTGDALDRITAQVLATSDVFDKDLRRVLESQNALAQGFGISFQEAGKILQDAFIIGADRTDELLDITREYPTLLKQSGINAQQLVNILNSSIDQGVFSDKGIDLIKEADIRLRELTPATRDALKGIGLSVQEIERGLRTGALTTFDVVQQVSKRLQTLPDTAAEVGTAIADIFGGPGEDAGIKFLRTLGDINNELDVTNQTLTEQQKLQRDLLKSTEDLNLSYNRLLGQTSGVFTELRIVFNEFLSDILDAPEKIAGAILPVNKGIFNLFSATFRAIFASTGETLSDTEKRIADFEKRITEFQQQQAAKENEAEKQRLERAKKAESEQRKLSQVRIQGEINDLERLKNSRFASEEEQLNATRRLAASRIELARVTSEILLENDKLTAIQRKLIAEQLANDIRKITGDLNEELKGFAKVIQREVPASLEGIDGEIIDLLIPPTPEFETRLNEVQEVIRGVFDRIREEQQERRAEDLQAEKEQRIAAAMETFSALTELQNAFFEGQNIRIQQQIAAEQQQREINLEAAGDNIKQRELIESESDQRLNDLRKRQSEIQKQQAIFNTAIQQGPAIARTAAQLGFPLAIPFIAAVALLFRQQIANTNAQAVPQFGEGEFDIDAPPHSKGGKMVNIEGRESIASKRVTKKFDYALKPMIKDKNLTHAKLRDIVNANVPDGGRLDFSADGMEGRLDTLIKLQKREKRPIVIVQRGIWNDWRYQRYRS